MNDMISDERWNRLEYIIEEAVPEDISGWRFRYSKQVAAAVEAAGFRRSEVPETSDPEGEGSSPWREIQAAKDLLAEAYGPGEWSSEPQGEPSDAHLSNVSINGVRQTWQQLYESEHEAHVALQGYRTMLSDLDRNAGGRHEGDYDSFASDNGGISAGNPHLTTGQIIGYDIGGREYVVPEPRERGTLSAWVRAAGGVR